MTELISVITNDKIKNKINVVKELLKNGADPNERTDKGYTALMCAIQKNHIKIVKELLKNGADPNIVTDCNRTAIYYACEYTTYIGNIMKITEELLIHGASVDIPFIDDNFKNIIDVEQTELLVKYGLDMDKEINNNGDTILTYLINRYYIYKDGVFSNFIRKIVKNGHDLNKKNKNGEDTLTLLLKNKRAITYSSVELFIELGAVVDYEKLNIIKDELEIMQMYNPPAIVIEMIMDYDYTNLEGYKMYKKIYELLYTTIINKNLLVLACAYEIERVGKNSCAKKFHTDLLRKVKEAL